jgi:hypothetical protein
MMRRVLKIALATAAISLTASPAFAQSATVNGATLSTGGSTTIHFGGPAGSTASADLFLQLTNASTAAGTYDFSYTFTNTNPSVSNLVNFGFTTAPTLLNITGTGMNFYLLNWMFGAPDNCLGASLTRHFSAEVEDQVSSLLQFPGGVIGQVSVDWSDPSVRKMTTKLSIWGDVGKLYVDRTDLQLFLTGKHKLPVGYGGGWTVRHITDLTPPVSFYLRGEEYSAQLEAFGRAILAKEPQRNDFASAAATDLTIQMIEERAAAAPEQGEYSASAPPKSLLARVFSR